MYRCAVDHSYSYIVRLHVMHEYSTVHTCTVYSYVCTCTVRCRINYESSTAPTELRGRLARTSYLHVDGWMRIVRAAKVQPASEATQRHMAHE